MSLPFANGDVAVPVSDAQLFYKTLLENGSDGIGLLDANGCVKYCMSSVRRLLGYEPASRIGKYFFSLMHPDDVRKFEEPMKNLIASPGKSLSFTARFRHNDGGWKTLDIRAINMLNNPAVEGIFINYRDVTESLAMSRALQESEQRFRSLAAVSPVGIFRTDRFGKCTYVNEKWTELSGLSYEESLGDGWAKNIHPDDLPSVREDWVKAIASGRPSRKEYRLCHPSGKITKVYCQAVPEKDAAGNFIGYTGSVTDISERAVMETALQQSEERYRNLVENAFEAIFIVDPITGRFLDFNRNTERLFGYSRQQLLNMTVMDLLPPLQPDGRDSLATGKELVRKALKKGRVVFEWFHIDASGRAFPCEVRLVRFPPYDKKLLRGTVIDITERKALEKKLREQELEYKHLASVSPVGIFRTDAKGKTIYVNDTWCRFTGIPAGKATGNRWLKAVHPEDRSLVWKEWKNALKKRKISRAQFRFLTPEGKLHWVMGEAVPDYDEQGNFTGFAGSITDITQQMEADLALKASEENWRTLVTSAPQYIATIDANDRITFINHSRILKPAQIIGKSVYRLVNTSGVNRREIKKLLHEARKGKEGAIEFSVVNPLNEVMWFNVKAAPVKRADKNGDIIVMALDITERKKAEEELQETNRKLKSLYQRLESIREEEKKNIALEIHDELGQELTAIKLGMFWMQHYFETRQRNPDLRLVKEKVKSLITLSGKTIGSVRKLVHQLRPVMLDNLGVIPAIEGLIEKINESGNIRCSLKSNIGNEKFKPGFSIALFRIIQESLTNILRHSKATRASVALEVSGNELILTVHDNGKGIKPADLKRPGKIGLFGMKERALSENGKFEISGLPGKGTVLKVVFPLKKVISGQRAS